MKYINLKLPIFSKLYILLLICQLSHSIPYRLTLKTPSSKNSNSNKDSITVTSEDIKHSVRNRFFGKDGHSQADEFCTQYWTKIKPFDDGEKASFLQNLDDLNKMVAASYKDKQF